VPSTAIKVSAKTVRSWPIGERASSVCQGPAGHEGLLEPRRRHRRDASTLKGWLKDRLDVGSNDGMAFVSIVDRINGSDHLVFRLQRLSERDRRRGVAAHPKVANAAALVSAGLRNPREAVKLFVGQRG